jgi:hypothetical protein
MENTMQQTPAEERLPWHKPRIEQLVVTLDTRVGAGSAIDGDELDPGHFTQS